MGFVDADGLKHAFTKLKTIIDRRFNTLMSRMNNPGGGQNLLLDTKGFERTFEDDENENTLRSVTNTSIVSNLTYHGCAVREATVTIQGENVWGDWTVHDCHPGEYYTFSFWARGDGEFVSTFFYGPPGGYCGVSAWYSSVGCVSSASDGRFAFPITSSWKRYWVTYQLDASYTGNVTDKYVLIRSDSTTVGKSAQICGCKLEHGTFPTDYSEAPDDLPMTASDVEAVFLDVFGQ